MKDLLENAGKYQIDSVSDGLYAGYLEKKYSISLKKSKDGEPTLFETNSEVLQLLVIDCSFRTTFRMRD